LKKEIGTAPWQVFGADGSTQLTGTIQGGSVLTGPTTINGLGTLPVVLMNFTAVAENGVVALNWATAQESNSDHFSVERSTDNGSHWQILGNVAAQGYSSSQVNYSFSDQSPVSGVNQYRLLAVDRDGKSGYSIIKVVRTNLISGVSVYPNPAKDYVNVSIGTETTSGASIRLINQAGQTLAQRKLSGAAGTTVSLPVSSYPQGNYLIVVTGADGSQQTSKVFISRQ
ncbi:MAG TPA: T9SS type A sorting domain-containing protein, partial [Puia sp.]|nr:T9SS type A sorting domain-containing protein [Puia sp.]